VIPPESAPTLTLARLAKSVNRPSIAMAAILLGVGLGILRFPFVAYLQPVGDFYVALLQICVLPFLLATIPLAVRSAMTSGTGGKVVGRLVGWLVVTVIVTTSIALLVAIVVFGFMPADPGTISRVGALFGASADRVDIELTLNPLLAATQRETGFLAGLPTNIFSALASNDSMTVIVFAAIFGAAMVISERSSGTSIFGALKHIQTVCLLVFDWFNVLAPVGIIALIAPQVARIGPEIYSILAPFVYVFLVTSLLLLALAVVVIVDPVMAMVRGVLNVAANSQIPVLAAWHGTSLPVRAPAA
jgi:Na+/H+-dicarboxylate symporter